MRTQGENTYSSWPTGRASSRLLQHQLLLSTTLAAAFRQNHPSMRSLTTLWWRWRTSMERGSTGSSLGARPQTQDGLPGNSLWLDQSQGMSSMQLSGNLSYNTNRMQLSVSVALKLRTLFISLMWKFHHYFHQLFLSFLSSILFSRSAFLSKGHTIHLFIQNNQAWLEKNQEKFGKKQVKFGYVV